MCLLTTTVVLVATCCTSVLLQEDVLYIPMRLQQESEFFENVVPKTNHYHPLTRFRPMEVEPAYLYIIDKKPAHSEEDQLNGGALIQLLNLIYEENFDEDTPNKFPRNIIRFGLIR